MTTTRRKRSHPVCLVLIDVINAISFPNSEGLARAAKRAAPRIVKLAERAREADVPVIYVNDNFGKWRSNFKELVHECTKSKHPGGVVSAQLQPKKGDYFILKPQHSGFYSTPLELLLDHLGAHSLILAGFAADLCVLFTAHDAHMRGFRLCVPPDCAAANTPKKTRDAVQHIKEALHGQTCPSTEIDFAALSRLKRRNRGQTF